MLVLVRVITEQIHVSLDTVCLSPGLALVLGLVPPHLGSLGLGSRLS